MRKTLVCLALTTFQVTQISVVLAQNSSTFEQTIISEINRARSNPPAYANWLETIRQTYDPRTNTFQLPGRNGRFPVVGSLAAFDEAIGVLRSTSPVQPLRASNGLGLAARDHLRDQQLAASVPQISHTGRDGSSVSNRVNRYGTTSGVVGENIGIAHWSEFMVMGLMLDYWEPSRGHRKNFLNPAYRLVGVACGNSSIREVDRAPICVMDFAQEYSENGGNPNRQRPDRTDIPPIAPNQPNRLSLNGSWVLESRVHNLGANCEIINDSGNTYRSKIIINQSGGKITVAGEFADFNRIREGIVNQNQIRLSSTTYPIQFIGTVSNNGNTITFYTLCQGRAAGYPIYLSR